MRSLKWVLVLAIPALLAAADQPAEQLVPEGTTIRLILLRQRSVQEELKIDQELAKKIIEFTNKEYEAWQQALKLSDQEREQRLNQLQQENERFLGDNLTADQRKRLDQITMQVAGLQLLTRPEAIRALNLTQEQQQKFKEMQKEARQELESIINDRNREAKNERLAKLRADIDKKVEAVLTDEQKEKCRELVGEPFRGEIVIGERP
jgi:hypothetical protein